MPALNKRESRMEEQQEEKENPESVGSSKPKAVRSLYGPLTEADRQKLKQQIEEMNKNSAEVLSNYEFGEVIRVIPARQRPPQQNLNSKSDSESELQEQPIADPPGEPEDPQLP